MSSMKSERSGEDIIGLAGRSGLMSVNRRSGHGFFVRGNAAFRNGLKLFERAGGLVFFERRRLSGCAPPDNCARSSSVPESSSAFAFFLFFARAR